MHPDQTLNNDRPILGWLAIASYLGVEKTTAQRWERQNEMPVHRMPGRRGGVYARAQELDAWRTSTDPGGATAPSKDTDVVKSSDVAAAPENGPSRAIVDARVRFLEIADGVLTLRLSLRSRWWWATAGGVALLVGSAAAGLHPTPSAALRAEGATPVVKNASGHGLWRHTFPAAAWPECLQLNRNGWMGELVASERFRAMFPVAPFDSANAESCSFNPQGHVEWEFAPQAGYEIEAFRAIAAGQNNETRIEINRGYRREYSGQVVPPGGIGRLNWNTGMPNAGGRWKPSIRSGTTL